MVRHDGRSQEEFRSVFLKTKVISQAKGSCYAEFNNTKLMVGVYGPRQTEMKMGFSDTGRLNCEVKLTTFAALKLSKTEQTNVERDFAAGLQQALTVSVQLHKFPKSVFDVYAMVLESGGSDLAVLITAASVALADAGIELYDLVPATQVSKVRGELLLDPSLEESSQQDGGMLVALMPSSSEVTQLHSTGLWSNTEMREGLELCMGGCGQLKAVMRETLLSTQNTL